MKTLETLITSGRIVDFMLAFIVVEVLLLAFYRYRFKGPLKIAPLLVNIAAGGSLILALRATLNASGWPLVAAFLFAAMTFHVVDLFVRWQEARVGDRRS